MTCTGLWWVVPAVGIGLGLYALFEMKERRQQRIQPKIQRRWELLDTGTPLPDLNSRESMQRFTLDVVKLAEELINAGQVEHGIRHLALAVALVGDTRGILKMIQPSLPMAYYNRLLITIMDIRPGCRLPELPTTLQQSPQ